MPGDTGNCTDCGAGDPNPNPFDSCGRSLLSCDNPCRRQPGNTAACESLPSQIQNFTLQFFGTIVKTEVNGIVQWLLPCSLDVGLPNNPRGVDEGLACYFLRLFQQNGSTGPQGPPGAPGPSGCNGINAYTVTLQPFSQPTAGRPIVQVVTQFNPVISPGLTVFITGSGWYTVSTVSPSGILFLAVQQTLSNAPATIAPGALVIPTGVPGMNGTNGANGISGPMGPQGPAGPQGVQGPTGANAFGNRSASMAVVGGSNYVITGAYTPVDFGTGPFGFLATTPGTYFVSVYAGITATTATANEYVAVNAKLYSVDSAADIFGSEVKNTTFPLGPAGPDAVEEQLILQIILTTTNSNDHIQLYVQSLGTVATSVVAARTRLNWIQIA